MANKFATVVFLQGEEAQECLDLYRCGLISDAIAYMKQWEHGEGYYDFTDEPEKSGDYYQDGNFHAVFNVGMDYCGLEIELDDNGDYL